MSTPAPIDPVVPNWAELQLPDSWADQLRLWHPLDFWRLVKGIVLRQRVQLPDNLPGQEWLPKYVLQEFHNLPNGNYSKRLTHGYITGFDRMMLGSMRPARAHLAQHMQHCHSVLDVGTAGGRTAAALHAIGVPDVWAIDPSPYLLQHAARRFPQIKFVQSIAEHTPFTAQRFEGITACFVLHELPPKQIEAALHEFARILKPGGLLAICEPSAAQMHASKRTLWQQHGWQGVYFKLLADWVHEPFVRAWHRLNLAQALHRAGFELLSDTEHFPARMVLARLGSHP